LDASPGRAAQAGDQIKDARRQRFEKKRFIHPAQVPPDPILGVWAQARV